MKSDLAEIVRRGTPEEDAHLIPVIEKELLHYDVLDALEKLGLLEDLVLHGGTCLRLCYGAERRSEDLDFAYPGDLEELDLGSLEETINGALERKFGLRATVRPPQKTVEFASAKMQRWWMIVDTAPERPDLPSQRLKIELISVRTFTRVVRRIAKNYDYLAPSSGNTIAVCESLEEILADKMVEFVNTPATYMRKRDAWDMMALLANHAVSKDAALSLVASKMEIYGCPLSFDDFAAEGASRVNRVVGSQDFAKEMLRFMPEGSFDALLGSSMKLRFAIDEVCALYHMVSG